MEGVERVVESQLDSGGVKLVFRDTAFVECLARVEELAGPTGRLLWRVSEMLTQMTRIRHGQLLQSSRVLALSRQVNQGFCQGELVRGDVASKEDDAPPVGPLCRSGFYEGVGGVIGRGSSPSVHTVPKLVRLQHSSPAGLACRMRPSSTQTLKFSMIAY